MASSHIPLYDIVIFSDMFSICQISFCCDDIHLIFPGNITQQYIYIYGFISYTILWYSDIFGHVFHMSDKFLLWWYPLNFTYTTLDRNRLHFWPGNVIQNDHNFIYDILYVLCYEKTVVSWYFTEIYWIGFRSKFRWSLFSMVPLTINHN